MEEVRESGIVLGDVVSMLRDMTQRVRTVGETVKGKAKDVKAL